MKNPLSQWWDEKSSSKKKNHLKRILRYSLPWLLLLSHCRKQSLVFNYWICYLRFINTWTIIFSGTKSNCISTFLPYSQSFTRSSQPTLFLALAGLSDRSYNHCPFFDTEHIQERVGYFCDCQKQQTASMSRIRVQLSPQKPEVSSYLPNSCLLQ